MRWKYVMKAGVTVFQKKFQKYSTLSNFGSHVEIPLHWTTEWKKPVIPVEGSSRYLEGSWGWGGMSDWSGAPYNTPSDPLGNLQPEREGGMIIRSLIIRFIEKMPNKKMPCNQIPIEPGNSSPWLADNQSPDLNNEFWLVVYLSVTTILPHPPWHQSRSWRPRGAVYSVYRV